MKRAIAFLFWMLVCGSAMAACPATEANCPSPTYNAVQAGNLELNVKGPPYNAKCDGTTDDTAAIQSAIGAGIASGVSFTLKLPAGVCKTSSALTIAPPTSSGQNVSIKGESRSTSQILVTGSGDGIDVTMSQASSTIFSGMLDVSDFTMLTNTASGTAIKAASTAANAVSPKFTNLRIGYLGTGSFANGITVASMSNIVVHNVNINSQYATGVAFQFDGNATFPSITDIFSDIYFWNFATGIQIGNGTSTSYVQGVEVVNAQLQQNNGMCVNWNNSTAGFLGDQFLMTNSFCNGSVVINNVEDIVVQGNYFLSGGLSQISVTTATSGILSGNTFNANNVASTIGIGVTNSHVTVLGNQFINYGGSPSAPIVFNAGTTSNIAIGNVCDACISSTPVVNDFGNNWYADNINNANSAATGGLTTDTIIKRYIGQQTWDWHPGGSPAFFGEGMVFGWSYAGQGEADVFLSRGAGGAGGFSENWYDTTSGSVGNQLMGLTVNGDLGVRGAFYGLLGTTTISGTTINIGTGGSTTTFAGSVVFPALPTNCVGKPTGAQWNNGNNQSICP